ncbi:MAG: PAS domain S-box protein, partial [Limisphaerales bacterium]
MEQGAFGNILGLLQARSGVDFSNYKQAILKRRIKRRMTTLHLDSADDYEYYLRAHPSETQSLLNDILVIIGGFFGIPSALKWFKRAHVSPRPGKIGRVGSENDPGAEREDSNSHFPVIHTVHRSATSPAAPKTPELKDPNALPGLFKALVDSSDDAIAMKDLNGIIRTWNKGAERIFGYTAEEIVGKSVTQLFPPALLQEEPEILRRIRSGERIDHYETVRVHKDGHLLDVSLTVSPIINAQGRIIGASKIARDISERKRWEADLKRAHDEAAQANHAKDNFLATLSHELRTPLNPVLLLAGECAADRNLPPGLRANFDIIRRNIELEAHLIDDLLDLTRIRTGKLRVHKKHVNIHALLSDTISLFKTEFEQKQIRLRQNLADAEGVVSGDAVRLRQIFWNILKNAIKFTPRHGSITVESRARNGRFF